MKRGDFHDLPSRFHVFGSARGIGAALVAGCLAACDVAPEPQDDDPRLELDDEDAVWSEDDDDLDDSVGFAEHVRVDSNDNGVIDGMDDLVPIDDPVEIGEMACAGQVFFDASDGGYASVQDGALYASSTAPNTSYGTAGCPGQYVVEVTNTLGHPLRIIRDWVRSSPENPSSCTDTSLDVTVYGAFQLFGYPAWARLAGTSMHAVWHAGPITSECFWVLDAGEEALPELDASHGFTKIRIALRATKSGSKRRVTGGVHWSEPWGD